jgi:5-(carboxyamino)imidazole ribonucleotide synthase
MNKLHLYGKSEPKIGRKMGHITILGKSTQSIMASIQQTITNLGMD